MEKLEKEREKNADFLPVMRLGYLYGLLDKEERAFVKKFLKIEPSAYGHTQPYLGVKPVPLFMKKIENQTYLWKGEEKEIPAQYLPFRAWWAYRKLNKAIGKDIGKPLLIKSGYRSSAYQILTFLYYLVQKHNFDYKKTLSLVALPGYSEHGCPDIQGIDFITTDGVIAGPEISFDKTKEYQWLLKNASKYRFYLSYPKNNKYNLTYEPWHWHYSK